MGKGPLKLIHKFIAYSKEDLQKYPPEILYGMFIKNNNKIYGNFINSQLI